MAEAIIRDMTTGRPVNPKIDSKLNATRQRVRKAIVRTNVKTSRELNSANTASAKQNPQAIGRKAGKITKEFAAGKIDMTV